MDISRDSDENGLRWYTNGDVSVLSVTTVLGFLDEDTTGLERWQDKNDGTDGRPHHEHIFWYSGPRGTLCHYQALKAFEDAYEADEDMWGGEEIDSMQQITDGPADGVFDDASHDLDDITYSILRYRNTVTSRDEYDALFSDSTRLVDVLHDDIQFFTDTFHHICDELGVGDDSVIRVEKYLLNDDRNYGGQCDLLYEAPNGDVVLADLKTSSGLRQKHRLQAVAYMNAVEQSELDVDTVDRVEVWRIHPDSETWQVHSHSVPEYATHLYDENNRAEAHYTDAYWFDDKYGDFSYDSLDDMWRTFCELTVRATREATDEDTQ